MGITSESLINHLYFKKLPQVYRDEDSKIKYPLKRYLESLAEGGFSSAIKDIEGTSILSDPKNIPEELFPYLCGSFGLEYFPDIEVIYQRRFLSNLGELVKRRGTYSSIHFLIRALTGLECELTLDGNNLSIVLLVKSVEQTFLVEPSIRIANNYIRSQIPYYINPIFFSRLVATVIDSKSYSHSAIVLTKKYNLTTYKEE